MSRVKTVATATIPVKATPKPAKSAAIGAAEHPLTGIELVTTIQPATLFVLPGIGSDVLVSSTDKADEANGSREFAAKVTQVCGNGGCVNLIVFLPFRAPEHWDSVWPAGNQYASSRCWRWPGAAP